MSRISSIAETEILEGAAPLHVPSLIYCNIFDGMENTLPIAETLILRLAVVAKDEKSKISEPSFGVELETVQVEPLLVKRCNLF